MAASLIIVRASEIGKAKASRNKIRLTRIITTLFHKIFVLYYLVFSFIFALNNYKLTLLLKCASLIDPYKLRKLVNGLA